MTTALLKTFGLLACETNQFRLTAALAFAGLSLCSLAAALWVAHVRRKADAPKDAWYKGTIAFTTATAAATLTLCLMSLTGLHTREALIHGEAVGREGNDTALIRDMEGTFAVHGFTKEHLDYIEEGDTARDYVIHYAAGGWNLCLETERKGE